MHDDKSGRNFRRSTQRTGNNFSQQGARNSLTLPIAINRQSTKYNSRNISRHVASHGTDDVLGQNLPHTQRKEAHDLASAFGAYHVGSACACFYVFKRPQLQPLVKNTFARLKCRKPMSCCEKSWRIKLQQKLGLLPRRFSVKHALHSGFLCGGRSFIHPRHDLLKFLSINKNC